MKILRAIRQRQPRTKQILRQHTTRFQPHESSTVIPESPPPVNDDTLTIRLVFPGRELPTQDFVTPITATVRQLTKRINALFISPSLITTALLYIRPSGSTWTRFNRPGPISNDFLPGEFLIPCASLQQGTILRVVPYFLTCNEENKKNDSEEGDNASNDEHKEDPCYYNHK